MSGPCQNCGTEGYVIRGMCRPCYRKAYSRGHFAPVVAASTVGGDWAAYDAMPTIVCVTCGGRFSERVARLHWQRTGHGGQPSKLPAGWEVAA